MRAWRTLDDDAAAAALAVRADRVQIGGPDAPLQTGFPSDDGRRDRGGGRSAAASRRALPALPEQEGVVRARISDTPYKATAEILRRLTLGTQANAWGTAVRRHSSGT